MITEVHALPLPLAWFSVWPFAFSLSALSWSLVSIILFPWFSLLCGVGFLLFPFEVTLGVDALPYLSITFGISGSDDDILPP